MKKFVAVIGRPHSGKSTIIQSLTGAKSRNFKGTVKDLSARKDVEVIAKSPQEDSEASLSEVRSRLNKAKRRGSSVGVVMAIQPRAEWTKISMERIFKAAKDRGFKMQAFVLEPPYKPINGWNAGEVEKRIQNAKVPFQRLDARKFAHQNAAIIRDTVGLF